MARRTSRANRDGVAKLNANDRTGIQKLYARVDREFRLIGLVDCEQVYILVEEYIPFGMGHCAYFEQHVRWVYFRALPAHIVA